MKKYITVFNDSAPISLRYGLHTPVRGGRSVEKVSFIYFRAVGAEPMLRTYGTLIT